MIQVSIRRSELVAEGACSDGLALYDSILAHRNEHRGRRGLPARDRLVMRWTRLHTLMLATSHPGFHGWCVERGILPQASLAGANLAGANLAGANLAGAYLDGANLDGANLAGANLAGAYLARANLDGANLDGAYLARANLAGANLAGANLAGAYLARANLDGANLAGANLAGANLDGANLDGAKRNRHDVPIYGWDGEPASCGCCVRLRRAARGAR